ncbi:hypothetical protein QE250_11745 [Chromatiaceae bacterium AAb-1]|nr:hypothetical protein [Chromatiaceae bacterium AAb-1]
MNFRLRLVLFILCWLGIGLHLAVTLPTVSWSTNITAAFPTADHNWQQQLLQQNRSSRHLSLLLTGPEPEQLQQAATQLQQRELNGLQWHKPAALLQQIQQQYRPFYGLVATSQQLQQLQQKQYQPLVSAAWQRLLSPAPLPENVLQQDPLLLTQQFIEQLAVAPSALTVSANWLEGRYQQQHLLLLQAELDFDPFERKQTALLQQQLTAELAQLQQQWPQLTILRSGVLFHAAAAADSAEFEMAFYGSLSALAILLLLLLSFRSLKPLLLTLLVLSAATGFGLMVFLWCYPQPHILSLVFATTLIGVAVDYSFHGMLATDKGRSGFRKMLPSLTLGLCTTLLGYLVLIGLPFAVLNQVAVFICSGLLAAYLTVRLLFPQLLSEGQLQTRPWLASACRYVASHSNRISSRGAALSLLVLALLSTTVLFSIARFSDDVRKFTQSPPALLEQEKAVRQQTSQLWESRFLVVLGNSAEQLLQQEQQLQPLLQHWQQQGWLDNWQALSAKIPSQSRQELTASLLQQAYQSPELQHYLHQLQLNAPAVPQQRLLPEHLPLFSQLHLVPLAEQQQASLIFLQGIHHPAAGLQQQLQHHTNVYWFDPVNDASNSINKIRMQLLYWVAIALLLSGALLSWRLGLVKAVAVILYLSTAVSGSLILCQLIQQQLNLFHLVATLLVIALSLDYAIFFSSSLPRTEVVKAVILSALTSSMAFGILGFSQTPAIAAFGLTVFLGVMLAAIMAPLISRIGVKHGVANGTC